MSGSAAPAPAVTPLGEAAKAALQGEFGKSVGARRLHTEVQAALVRRYVARGEALTELPLDVEKDDVASWEAGWRAELTASGITDAGDSVRFIQWLHARSNFATQI